MKSERRGFEPRAGHLVSVDERWARDPGKISGIDTNDWNGSAAHKIIIHCCESALLVGFDGATHG